jgi:hypothetical protein
MKKLFGLLFLLFVLQGAFAQIKSPVKWSFTSKKLSDNSYEIHLTATIEKGWHIYSQTTPDGGPVPTAINFSKNPLLIMEAAAKEIGKMEQHNEPLFGVLVKQYSDKVDFVQVVKLKSKVKTVAAGKLEFMVCNNRECLPPSTVSFSVPLQ